MDKKCLLLYVAIFLIFSPYFVYAQRSIGEVKKDSEVGESTLDYPLEKWVNKRFIFLDLEKYDRQRGYSELSLRKSRIDLAPRNSELEEITGLKYNKFRGKIIKAVDCEKDPETSNRKTLTFIEEDSKMKIYGHTLTVDDCIHGIALFDDLDKAKERWRGKSVYSKYKNIVTYNQDSDSLHLLQIILECLYLLSYVRT